MNIIEAIKSDRAFRPKGGAWGPHLHFPSWKKHMESWGYKQLKSFLLSEFEVEERKVEVTKKQLINAMQECIAVTSDEFGHICKKLGLQD